MNSASYHAQAFEASVKSSASFSALTPFDLTVTQQHLDDWMQACKREGLDVNDQTLVDPKGRPSPLAQWILLNIKQASQSVQGVTPSDAKALIQSLLSHGLKADNVKPVPEHWTLLQLAAGHGYLDIAQLCIEAGADVNHYGSFGGTPLFLATENGHRSLVELLLLKGAQPNLTPLQEVPLHASIQQSHWPIFDLLLKHGADPDLQNKKGMSALMVAVARGSFDSMTRLIQQGAHLDLQNHLGESACHLAVFVCRPDLLQPLVEAGARVDLIDRNFETPMQKAKDQLLTGFSTESITAMIDILTIADHIAMEVAALKSVTAPKNPQNSEDTQTQSLAPDSADPSRITGKMGKKQSRYSI